MSPTLSIFLSVTAAAALPLWWHAVKFCTLILQHTHKHCADNFYVFLWRSAHFYILFFSFVRLYHFCLCVWCAFVCVSSFVPVNILKGEIKTLWCDKVGGFFLENILYLFAHTHTHIPLLWFMEHHNYLITLPTGFCAYPYIKCLCAKVLYLQRIVERNNMWGGGF